jgi:hypothetical protein
MLRTTLPIAVTVLLWAGTSPVPATSQTRERDPRTVVVQLRDRGFHWTDAGIGALATLGLIAAGAGATLALRRGGDGRARPAAARIPQHEPIEGASKRVNDQRPEGKPPCPQD